MTSPITDLAVTCRFQMLRRSRDIGRYDWVECGDAATSGVHETGSHFAGISWRCDAHRGQLRPGVAAEAIDSADRADYLRYCA